MVDRRFLILFPPQHVRSVTPSAIQGMWRRLRSCFEDALQYEYRQSGYEGRKLIDIHTYGEDRPLGSHMMASGAEPTQKVEDELLTQ